MGPSWNDAFVVVCGCGRAGVAAMFRNKDRSYWKTALLLFGITASHGVLDAMTNGGLGIAFFSPFTLIVTSSPGGRSRVSHRRRRLFFRARECISYGVRCY